MRLTYLVFLELLKDLNFEFWNLKMLLCKQLGQTLALKLRKLVCKLENKCQNMSRSLVNMLISIRQLLWWWNMNYGFYLDGLVTSMGLGTKVYQGSSVPINTQKMRGNSLMHSQTSILVSELFV